MLNTCTTYFR